jgi:predicted permease
MFGSFSLGLLVGWVMAKLTQTPSHQIRTVMVACAFGNSTGLPITLLTVVHANFPSTSDLGRIDPTLFLSVYLLLYPALQWGVGGWLLAPPAGTSGGSNHDDYNSAKRIDKVRINILNNKPLQDFYNHHRRGLSSIDECLYVSEV